MTPTLASMTLALVTTRGLVTPVAGSVGLQRGFTSWRAPPLSLNEASPHVRSSPRVEIAAEELKRVLAEEEAEVTPEEARRIAVAKTQEGGSEAW